MALSSLTKGFGCDSGDVVLQPEERLSASSTPLVSNKPNSTTSIYCRPRANFLNTFLCFPRLNYFRFPKAFPKN